MDIKAIVGAQIPGEAIVVAIINAYTETRRTMTPEHAARADALALQIQEDAYTVWRSFWQRLGVLDASKTNATVEKGPAANV